MATQDKTTETTSEPALSAYSNIILAAGIMMVLTTLLIPLPTYVLDLLLAGSISLSISVLIITLCSKEALELSTFPSLLLFVTLFRLSLNVASTRLILLKGNAGEIINTFGSFVAGGNIVVGLIIFLILAVIQFIVVTKGAERISEVSARFMLDAMPGKQMAIDADLNAGNITDTEARLRREKIVKESEFYGAMDGASKFIRGDALAGMIIVAVNLVGGIVMGYTRGMDLAEAMKKYCILSIGDGLVSQIPSIVIAVSSGFLVTKISSNKTVSQDLTRQLLSSPQPIKIAAGIVALMALVPGFPAIPFLVIAGGMAVLSRTMGTAKPQQKTEQQADQPQQKESKPVEELLDMDRISVLVGVRLISMVDPRKKTSIFDRIGALRRRFAQELGIILPLVRLRDNVNLEANAYEIRLSDHVVAKGRIEPELFLAMDSGTVTKKIKGVETKEPVYGLPAMWISPADRDTAEVGGYTVIDAESVLITHLSETLMQHAHELLTREDVQQLLDRLKQTQPSLVGDLVPEIISVGMLQRVMQNLLKDRIAVRDLPHIIEALADYAHRTKNVNLLTELSRKSLARCITERYRNPDGRIIAISLDPAFEHALTSYLKTEGEETVCAMPPEVAMLLTKKLAVAWQNAMQQGHENVVLICDSRLRAPLANVMSRSLHRLPVVAYDEIVVGAEIAPVETISMSETNAYELTQSAVVA
jgi:flagellar biosynthesis protein FlhA